VRVITFGTLKGGVGKTMLCFNIAGLLSSQGYKVLVIDSDLQGNLTNNIGIDRTLDKLPTMYDIYNTELSSPPPEEVIIKQPNKNIPNMDMIAGSIFLHRAELRLGQVIGREQVLSLYIEENSNFFAQYDYIFIDTNPSMSIVNQNAFLISDSILLVSDISMNSLEGAQLFIALWEESRRLLRKENNISGFIINDYDSRNKLSADFMEYLASSEDVEDLREIMIKTVIPRNIRITESELAAMPINIYDPSSKGSIAIAELVDELKAKNIF